jgi:hypothetical protein
VLFEKGLKVARLGAVAPADVHEDLADRAGIGGLLGM